MATGTQRNVNKINYHFAHRQGIEHDIWKSRLLSLEQDLIAAIDRGHIKDRTELLTTFQEQLGEWFDEPSETP